MLSDFYDFTALLARLQTRLQILFCRVDFRLAADPKASRCPMIIWGGPVGNAFYYYYYCGVVGRGMVEGG